MKQYYYGEWHDEGTGPFCAAKFPHAAGLHWRDKPEEFKREIRYEVYKRKDIDKLPPPVRARARAMLQELNHILDEYGAPQREYVVVEHDWPEYEPVWKMIEDRVTKPVHEIDVSLPPRMSLEEPSLTYVALPPNFEDGQVLPLSLNMPVTEPYGEIIGEQCIDGGKCHHNCKERCFRRECCAPFSTYDGPWKYEIPGMVVEEPAPAQTNQPEFNWEPIQALWRKNSALDWDELESAISQALSVRPAQTSQKEEELRDEIMQLKARLDHVNAINSELLRGLKAIAFVGSNNELRLRSTHEVIGDHFGSKSLLCLGVKC